VSEEHKAHEETVHEAMGHDAPPAGPVEAAAHESPAAEAHAEPEHAAVEPEAAPVEAVAHEAAPEVVAPEVVNPEVVAAVTEAVEAGAPEAVAEIQPEPVVEAVVEAVVPAEAAPEPEPASDPLPVEPVVVAAAAAVVAAASGSGKRPVWSDDGDAPFEDADPAPVKARKSGSSSGGEGNEFVEIFKTIGFALLIAMVLRILLFQPFTIPSASMEPNLHEGDYIVVSKWSYGYSKHSIPFSPGVIEGRIFERQPERGDIVVFKLPRDNKTDYIKRVIGLPGDRVQMINNKLYINGQAVEDVVVAASQLTDTFGPQDVTQLRETLPNGKSFMTQDFGPGFPLDSTPVFEVPAGRYFMMGDNRDNSVDSREQSSQGVGLVPAENLVGKAEIILFSWSPGASLFNPVSWFSKVRPSRFFTVLR